MKQKKPFDKNIYQRAFNLSTMVSLVIPVMAVSPVVVLVSIIMNPADV